MVHLPSRFSRSYCHFDWKNDDDDDGDDDDDDDEPLEFGVLVGALFLKNPVSGRKHSASSICYLH